MKSYKADTTINLVQVTKASQIRSTGKHQFLLDECSCPHPPFDKMFHDIQTESYGTLVMASLSTFEYRPVGSSDDEEGSLSESNLFGDFIPVDFEVRAEDEIKAQFISEERHSSMPNLSTTKKLGENSSNIVAGDPFSSIRGHRSMRGSSIANGTVLANEQEHSVISRILPAKDDENVDKSMSIVGGHGSQMSLMDAFDHLTTCMKKTAQSREMVKLFTMSTPNLNAQYYFNTPETYRNNTESQQYSKMLRTRSLHISSSLQASPVKSRISGTETKFSYRRQASQGRKECRIKKIQSRTTGVRPINWNHIAMSKNSVSY
jgi:hypothetical protein